jgi:hypothetical protein
VVSGTGRAASLMRTVSIRILSARLGFKLHYGGLSSGPWIVTVSPSEIRY